MCDREREGAYLPGLLIIIMLGYLITGDRSLNRLAGGGHKETEKETDSLAADNQRSISHGECCVMKRGIERRQH